jgi:hypothetical protein
MWLPRTEIPRGRAGSPRSPAFFIYRGIRRRDGNRSQGFQESPSILSGEGPSQEERGEQLFLSPRMDGKNEGWRGWPKEGINQTTPTRLWVWGSKKVSLDRLPRGKWWSEIEAFFMNERKKDESALSEVRPRVAKERLLTSRLKQWRLPSPVW